jgi:hypothetical protein
VIIAAFIPARQGLPGIGLQGLVLFGLYVSGIVGAMVVALVFRRTVTRGGFGLHHGIAQVSVADGQGSGAGAVSAGLDFPASGRDDDFHGGRGPVAAAQFPACRTGQGRSMPRSQGTSPMVLPWWSSRSGSTATSPFR